MNISRELFRLLTLRYKALMLGCARPLATRYAEASSAWATFAVELGARIAPTGSADNRKADKLISRFQALDLVYRSILPCDTHSRKILDRQWAIVDKLDALYQRNRRKGGAK